MKNKFLVSVLSAGCFALAGLGCLTVNNASASTTTPTITMDYGASIRVASDNQNGLRFTATVENATDGYEYHIVIVPEKYFERDTYAQTAGDTLTKLNAVHTELTGKTDGVNDYTCALDGKTARACITNIAYENSNLQFTALGYVKKADGEIVDWSDNKTTRSLTQITSYALMDTSKTYSTTVQGILDGYLEDGYNEAVGNQKGDEAPTLTIQVTETATKGNYNKAGADVVGGYEVAYEGTLLEDLQCIVKPTADCVEFKDGVIRMQKNLVSGDYEIALSAPKMEKATVTVAHTNMNVFSAEYVGIDAGWKAYYGANASMLSYEAENAVVYKQHCADNAISIMSDQGMMSFPIDMFKQAQADGMGGLVFSVRMNETMAKSTIPTDLTNNNAQEAGFRMSVTSQRPISGTWRPNYVVWEEDASMVNRNGVSDAIVYDDVYVSDMKQAEYTRIYVSLDDLLALKTNAAYFCMTLGNSKGACVYFRNAEWITAAEYKQYEAAKIERDKVSYASKNYAAQDMLHKWAIHKNTNYLTKTYDTEAGALKAEVITANGHSKSQTNIFAFGVRDIRYAYEKLGYTHLTVKWKASKEMLNPSSVATGTGRCVRLYSEAKNTTLQGYEIMNLPNLGTEYTTFEIDLSLLYKTTNTATHLCFVIGGDVGDAVWFESITLTKK